MPPVTLRINLLSPVNDSQPLFIKTATAVGQRPGPEGRMGVPGGPLGSGGPELKRVQRVTTDSRWFTPRPALFFFLTSSGPCLRMERAGCYGFVQLNTAKFLLLALSPLPAGLGGLGVGLQPRRGGRALGKHWDWAGGWNSQTTGLHVSQPQPGIRRRKRKTGGEWGVRKKGRSTEEKSLGCTASQPPM